MVIIEISLPTGFIVEKDAMNQIISIDRVKMIDTKNDDAIAVIYVERMMPEEEICVDVDGFRTYRVTNQQLAYVTVYDYYDSCM